MSYTSSVNTGLPNIADPPDPSFFPEFTRVYNAVRNIALALDAYTGFVGVDKQFWGQTTPATSLLSQNLQRLYVPASVNISYGQTVNLYSNAGVLTARLANASAAGTPMHGWCSTSGGVLAGATGEFMLGGLCPAISGLTIGSTYYQSNTAGSIGLAAGTISQKVGFAIGTTQLMVRPDLV